MKHHRVVYVCVYTLDCVCACAHTTILLHGQSILYMHKACMSNFFRTVHSQPRESKVRVCAFARRTLCVDRVTARVHVDTACLGYVHCAVCTHTRTHCAFRCTQQHTACEHHTCKESPPIDATHLRIVMPFGGHDSTQELILLRLV